MSDVVHANGTRRRRMPAQKPGKSVQEVATPPEFIAAIERRFGKIVFDLAASSDNAVGCNPCRAYFDVEQNSLKQDWARTYLEDCEGRGWLWLNPPFGNIDPWAEKCAAEMRRSARILLLTPASVGANWFHKHVRPHAHVIELGDRITFVGQTHPFPKDLIVSVFVAGITGRSWWKWKQTLRSIDRVI